MSYDIQKQILLLERDKKVIGLLDNLKSLNFHDDDKKEECLKNKKELYHYILEKLEIPLLKNIQCDRGEDLQIFEDKYGASDIRFISYNAFKENNEKFFSIYPLLEGDRINHYLRGNFRDYSNPFRTFKFYKEFTYKSWKFKICVGGVYEVYENWYKTGDTELLKPVFLNAYSNLLAMNENTPLDNYIFHLIMLNPKRLKKYLSEYFKKLLDNVIINNDLYDKKMSNFKKTKSYKILKELSNITDAEAEDIVKQLTL